MKSSQKAGRDKGHSDVESREEYNEVCMEKKSSFHPGNPMEDPPRGMESLVMVDGATMLGEADP